jgi:hypothetical protein
MNVAERDLHWLFIVTGFGCFLVAVYLSIGPQIDVPAGNTATKVEPHPASWGAAEGFAVAGGMCFLAAGLVIRSSDR